MSILVDQVRLRQAAAALYDIDQAGNLRELGEAIQYARKEHKRQVNERGIGTGIYCDQLATALSRTTGIPFWKCRSAISEAISPDWPTVALDAIVDFANDHATKRGAA